MSGVNAPFLKVAVVVSLFLIMISGCKKHELPPSLLAGYHQINLVADVAGYDAARIDPALVNPWGISFSATSPLWISAAGTSVSVIYDKNGMDKIPPVTIQNGKGSPTGQVFNGTTGFVIPGNSKPSKFIFCGEDGTITAWNEGTSAILVADRSPQKAVYKGMAMGNDGKSDFLYVANFKGSSVDVFDNKFNYVTNMPFVDMSIPADYGPFNIRNINGKLYVTYAKHKAPDNSDDQKGPGNGYVDIFDMSGKLLTRFASGGSLNSPWGIVPAAPSFSSISNAILIGNFGDGKINVFASDGNLIGSLKDESGMDIKIDGLWDIENNIHNADPGFLYFTAGPAEETHGLFGYLSKK